MNPNTRQHWQLIHVINDYDKRQARGNRYNRFALPQYLAALERAEADGEATRASLCGAWQDIQPLIVCW